MIGMGLPHIFDSKVIDHETKLNGARGVMKEARSVWSWLVTMGGQVGGKAGVGNDASLGKAIHALAYFDQNVVVVHQRKKIVLLEHDGGNVLERNAHVFISGHGRIEVKILDVQGEKCCIWGGYYTIKQAFGSREVRGWCADFARIINAIAADCKSDAFFLCFEGTLFSNNAKVCSCAAFG